jgi:hypothetical protein
MVVLVREVPLEAQGGSGFDGPMWEGISGGGGGGVGAVDQPCMSIFRTRLDVRERVSGRAARDVDVRSRAKSRRSQTDHRSGWLFCGRFNLPSNIDEGP